MAGATTVGGAGSRDDVMGLLACAGCPPLGVPVTVRAKPAVRKGTSVTCACVDELGEGEVIEVGSGVLAGNGGLILLDGLPRTLRPDALQFCPILKASAEVAWCAVRLRSKSLRR